jgi:hypothetical protein
LKGVLEGEWKSKENPILKKLTGREAQQSFLRQFERYAIDDESSSWLDNVEEGSTTPHDADFDVESEVDLSAEGFLVVLAEASPGGIQKDKKKPVLRLRLTRSRRLMVSITSGQKDGNEKLAN